jgi:hypothetical protein
MSSGLAFEGLETLGSTNLKDIIEYLGGKTTQPQVMREGGKFLNTMTLGQMPKTVGRFAGSNLGRAIARGIPLLSAAGNVGDVADIIAGPDSFGNKVMDTAGMGVGGTVGFLMGGPLGASVGASAGKSASDIVQGIFGGGKSAEQRKIEEAVKLLQQRGLV